MIRKMLLAAAACAAFDHRTRPCGHSSAGRYAERGRPQWLLAERHVPAGRSSFNGVRMNPVGVDVGGHGGVGLNGQVIAIEF